MKPLLVLVACCIAGPLAAGPGSDGHRTDPPRERCAALIALFDEVIVNLFDYQILMLEDYELADATDLRRAAETECTTGSEVFGLEMIESALHQIGVVPPWPDAAAPHG
jgi:hypothetical protein